MVLIAVQFALVMTLLTAAVLWLLANSVSGRAQTPTPAPVPVCRRTFARRASARSLSWDPTAPPTRDPPVSLDPPGWPFNRDVEDVR